MMGGVRSWLVGVLTSVYRPVERMPLEEWGEKNIVLRSKESIDNPGPYKRHHAIYVPRLLDEFMSNPEWRTLIVRKSSQSGFTLHVLILVCRMLIEAALNILYVMDTRENARDLSKVRLRPMLEDCRATSVAVRESEDEMTNLTYDLPNAALWLAGAQTAGQLASKPVGLAIGDELDKWRQPKGEAHSWDLLVNRIKRAESGKAIGFSSPTTEAGTVHTGFMAGSRHMYFVPCPHCGEKQVIEFEQIRYAHCRDARGHYDFQRVLADTWLECLHCHGRIDEDHKLDMMLGGEIRPTNFKEVEIDGVKQRVPGWMPGEMSFHISDLYSLHPSSTWGILAMEFIRAQGNTKKLHDFLNGRLGKPVRQTVSDVTEGSILRLRGQYKRGAMSVVPCVATMQIDNQGDHQKWVKSAFLPNGDQFVVDWGKSLTLEEADELVKTPIRLPDGREIFVQRVIIDEGGKGGTSYEVRQFCFSRFPAFFPCKGRGGLQVKNTIHFSNSALSKGGMEQIPVCHFDDDAFKRTLYIDRIKKFDAKRCDEYGIPRLWLPSDVSEEFVRELCGEQLEKKVGDNGVPVFVWVAKPPNDWGDCVKMGFVLWNIIGSQFQPVK